MLWRLLKVVAAVAVGLLVSPCLLAAPGSLATQPLITASVSPPNILFHLDTSGSMSSIVVDAPYDSGVTYSCPSSLALPANDSSDQDAITINILKSNGQAYFCYGLNNSLSSCSTAYDYGTTSGNGPTGRAKRCFNPTTNYYAALGANASTFLTNYAYEPNVGTVLYTGNYLNWYFGTSPTTWGANATQKPGTSTRMQVVQDATNNLLSSLQSQSVRVGLSTLYNGNGAKIFVGLDSISNNYSAMVSAVNGLSPGGGTPLGVSMLELGRYFVQGYNQTLTLHPGQSGQTTKSAYTVFNETPTYASGVSQSSPIQTYCQQSFIVLLTDGRPTGDTNISSSTGLINYNGLCTNANPACLSYDRLPQYIEQYPDGSGGSGYLADVTNAMYDMDLRPDLSSPTGQAVKNNVSTYTVGFADLAVQNNQLLQSAASLGGGQFFNALDTSGLTTAFQNITTQIFGRVSTAAAVTFNSTSLSSTSNLYQASFSTSNWSGDLVAYPVSTAGVIGTAIWDAANLLDAVVPTNREMITYNVDTKQGVPFRTLSSLSATQQADLNMGTSGSPDGNGQLRLNYLRGDRTNEGSLFRTRAHVLADIADSSPIYVGAPQSNWPDLSPFPTSSGSKFSDFANGSAKSRTPIVYVGNNGGSLDGFNANTGQIVFSYLPSNLFTSASQQGLHYLTDPNYQHIYYADLSPSVQDAYVKTTSGGSASWHTILVSGERGGGRGYFALDITNPSQLSEANANSIHMWDFTSSANSNLGYTFSQPVIGLLNNGRWAAIFGNGYNSTGTGTAQLFIVYLDGGLSGTWTQNTDYVVIDTKQGSSSNLNGLSSVAAIDSNSNRVIDRVYAGDLLGEMWAFDLSSTNQSSWKVAYGTTSSPLPLYNGSSTQPITAAPLVVQNPIVGNSTSPSNAPNMMVLFGTGQFLTTADKSTTTTQAFYGVWDSGTGNLTSSNLVQQTMVVNNGSKRVMNTTSVPYTGTGSAKKYGWYINLDAGERVITSATSRTVTNTCSSSATSCISVVYFDTLIPNNTGSCSYGGTGYIMAVNVFNGGQPSTVVLDTNNDSILNTTDKLNGSVVSGVLFTAGIPMQPSIRGDSLFIPGSNGTLSSYSIYPNSSLLGRISWQDLRYGH